MQLRAHITGLLAAVVLLVFALFPSAADAHLRHDRPVVASVQKSAAAAPSRGIVTAKISRPAAPVRYAYVSNLSADSTLNARHDANAQGDARCAGQCCDGACHACFAFTIPIGYDDGIPLFHESRDRIAEFRPETGLTPKALRKPPKTFV